VRLHLDEAGHGEVSRALGQHLVASPLRGMDGEVVLDGHHAPVRREILRVSGGTPFMAFSRPPSWQSAHALPEGPFADHTARPVSARRIAGLLAGSRLSPQ